MTLTSAQRAAFRARLLAWWDGGHRPLPWRCPQDGADPYRVWVAEVMLQQTQVATVIPYFSRFVERFPTLESLARAVDDDVLALWSGLGYYARARRMVTAAREALRRHGALPRTAAELRALPGFGPYTAGAVASIAFAQREACVDGNVARVLSRVFLVRGDPSAARVRDELWAIAAALVPRARPGDFNQAVMDLGATVCAPAAPACGRCPFGRGVCAARREGREREVPRARRRPRPFRQDLACAVLRREGSLLVERAAEDRLFGGLWGLPTVDVPPGGDARDALRRELRARWGGDPDVLEELACVERTLTHRVLRLTAFRCRLRRLPPAGPRVRLVTPAELERLAVSTAMRRLLERLPSPSPHAVPSGPRSRVSARQA